LLIRTSEWKFRVAGKNLFQVAKTREAAGSSAPVDTLARTLVLFQPPDSTECAAVAGAVDGGRKLTPRSPDMLALSLLRAVTWSPGTGIGKAMEK